MANAKIVNFGTITENAPHGKMAPSELTPKIVARFFTKRKNPMSEEIMSKFEAEKDDLIRRIKYYRDEYHHSDFGHTDMIEEILKTTSIDQLEPYQHVVDDWLRNMAY